MVHLNTHQIFSIHSIIQLLKYSVTVNIFLRVQKIGKKADERELDRRRKREAKTNLTERDRNETRENRKA